MKQKLTHEEACELVEKQLERSVSTLFYIRERLNKHKNSTLLFKEECALRQADLLCNINFAGAYYKGARNTLLKLRDCGMLNEIGAPKNNEEKWVNKALVDALLGNVQYIDFFVTGEPVGVVFYTEFTRDKKGKIIGAKGKYVKKKVEYEEI